MLEFSTLHLLQPISPTLYFQHRSEDFKDFSPKRMQRYYFSLQIEIAKRHCAPLYHCDHGPFGLPGLNLQLPDFGCANLYTCLSFSAELWV